MVRGIHFQSRKQAMGARVLENAAPGSMRRQPVVAGAYFDMDGDDDQEE